MSDQDLIKQLQSENAALKAKAHAKLKVQRTKTHDAEGKATSSNGNAVSVYGMGRFPVTLYPEQWASLFSAKEAIEAVCAEVLASPNAAVAPNGAAKVAGLPKASGF